MTYVNVRAHTPWLIALLLQHTATLCNTLQHAATHCSTLEHTAALCNALQCTAMHCNALQCTAMHCNALQHTATHCNTLQHTATHCNTLHMCAHTPWHVARSRLCCPVPALTTCHTSSDARIAAALERRESSNVALCCLRSSTALRCHNLSMCVCVCMDV